MAILKIKVSLAFLKQKVADKIQKAKVIITGITAQVAKLPRLA